MKKYLLYTIELQGESDGGIVKIISKRSGLMLYYNDQINTKDQYYKIDQTSKCTKIKQFLKLLKDEHKVKVVSLQKKKINEKEIFIELL